MNRRENESGVILLIVLWSVAIMSAAIVALSVYSSRSVALAGADIDVLRTELALESGVALGAVTILSQKPEARAFLDGAEVETPIGDGRMVSVGAMDAAGLVDLNRTPLDMVENLARAAGVSARAAKDLADELDSLRKDRAKGLEPDAITPPLFYSIAQLSVISDEETLSRLAPFSGLYSTSGKVNPMAAPAIVLAAVPGIGAADLRVLREARARRDWSGADATAVLEKFKAYLAVAEPTVYVVTVKARSGPGLIAGRNLRAVIAFAAAGDSPYHVLAWSW